MTDDAVRYLRHEARTYVNHIQGCVALLQEDLALPAGSGLAAEVEALAREAGLLRQALGDAFDAVPGGGEPRLNGPAVRRHLFGPLYIVLGLAQRLKKRCEDEGLGEVLADVLPLLEAGRKTLALVEQELEGEPRILGQVDQDYGFALNRLTKGSPRGEAETAHGRILVVDDNALNRDLLRRHLERQGHVVETVASGQEALDLLAARSVDLMLLDLLMPGLSGTEVLEALKASPALRDLPVIVISALEETEAVVRCIALGAEDYLPKSYDPILLKARISASLSRKRYRDRERTTLTALLAAQSHLERELAEAALYVCGLLPRPQHEGVYRADWVFRPSAQLGGDCFDYFWAAPGRLAFFLLDVSGHGIGAALLSVSVMTLLRSGGLPLTDFCDPAGVLTALNRRFPMEEQNNMFFSIWYGVWTPAEGRLVFACAGAPPALLVSPGAEPRELGTPDMIVGVDAQAAYGNGWAEVTPGSRLYLYSDGVYEVLRPDGSLVSYRDVLDLLVREAGRPGPRVAAVHDQILAVSGRDAFDDDFSLLELSLG